MDEQDIRELENPENWDFEKVQSHPGVKKPRAVVSVAFSREDFEKVEEQAEKLGVNLSRFVREAALERASSLEVRPASYVDPNTFVTFVNRPLRTHFVWNSSTGDLRESRPLTTEGTSGHLVAEG
jgi:predicted DNA binding CopG/RHH family protein